MARDLLTVQVSTITFKRILAYEVKFDDHLSSLDIEMVQTPMRIRDCWIVEKGQQGLDGVGIAQSALDDLEVGFAM